jgi:hypothetical protein
MLFEDIPHMQDSEIEAAISRNDVPELVRVVLSVGMHSENREWAETICIRLSTHSEEHVRGNAILAFGHLARRFGQLNVSIIKPIVNAALHDPSPFVRGQASAAVDDLGFCPRC